MTLRRKQDINTRPTRNQGLSPVYLHQRARGWSKMCGRCCVYLASLCMQQIEMQPEGLQQNQLLPQLHPKWDARRRGSDTAWRRARAKAGLDMENYCDWIATTFPNARLYGTGELYPLIIANFCERYQAGSAEYEDLLDFFISAADDRFMRIGVITFLENMNTEMRTARQLEACHDGEMHIYIQWIIKNLPNMKPEGATQTFKETLERFLQDTPRDSNLYKRVFIKFYASRNSNHTLQAMADFVGEIAWLTRLNSTQGGKKRFSI